MENIIQYFTQIDLGAILIPTLPFPEAFLRMSLVYLTLFFLLRIVLRREIGALGIPDLLVLVLVADGVQNAMADNYTSVTDGLILAAVLVFWDWFLSYLGFRWPRVRKVLEPAPLLLIRNGQIIQENLRKQLMTNDELMGELRLQGIGSIQDVQYAFLEPDGRVSIVAKEGAGKPHENEPRDVD